MRSKFLVVLGLCVAVSSAETVNATPLCCLSSKNEYDYGCPSQHSHPKKHRHDKYPPIYYHRLEDAKTNVTCYDNEHDADFEHKSYGCDGYKYKGNGGSYSDGIKEYSSGDCDEYDYKDYGDSCGNKSHGSDCDDYGDHNYGHGNDYSSFDKGYVDKGYGYDHYLRPNDNATYSGIYGCGIPNDGYFPGSGFSCLGFGFVGHFGRL